jgi:hypothetical protein
MPCIRHFRYVNKAASGQSSVLDVYIEDFKKKMADFNNLLHLLIIFSPEMTTFLLVIYRKSRL